MTSRKLTERHVRWSQVLSQFDFKIDFRTGKQSERPDALSRKAQDIPNSVDDTRLKERDFQLIQDAWVLQEDVNKLSIISTII